MNIQDERDLLSCPGDTILETLKHKGISVEDFAAALRWKVDYAERLIEGKEPLGATEAGELERYFGIDKQFWLNYEADYRSKLAAIEQAELEQRFIQAPFTDEQVTALQNYQDAGYLHPFTCMGHEGCKRPEQYNGGKLIPTSEGWVCACGSYTQNWAHSFMAQPLPENPLTELMKKLK